jgi:hypothetical protein
VEKGAVGGVATLGTTGRMPTAQGPAGLPADQHDYVAALAARYKYTRVQLKKNNSINDVEVTCFSPSGQHTTFQFYGGAAGDDYRILAQVWEGTFTQTVVQASKKLWSVGRRPGFYLGNSNEFLYTTDKITPASFTASVSVDVDGSDLRFHTYRDNKGGIWEIKVSGPAATTVSTWASVAAYNTAGVVLLTNLRPGAYTISASSTGTTL